MGSNNFYIEIIEEFDTISIEDLHNKESEYIKLYNSIENGYNERLDINNKCITSLNTKEKMSVSSKKVWKSGAHNNHARKLSKFKYNIYDLHNNLLDKDITSKEITNKYKIHSSNIFMGIKKGIINKYGKYDETITYKLTIKHYIVERIYIGGTKRGDYKNIPQFKSNITFILHKNK